MIIKSREHDVAVDCRVHDRRDVASRALRASIAGAEILSLDALTCSNRMKTGASEKVSEIPSADKPFPAK